LKHTGQVESIKAYLVLHGREVSWLQLVDRPTKQRLDYIFPVFVGIRDHTERVEQRELQKHFSVGILEPQCVGQRFHIDLLLSLDKQPSDQNEEAAFFHHGHLSLTEHGQDLVAKLYLVHFGGSRQELHLDEEKGQLGGYPL
jgi:hypothetical protein